MSAMRASRNVLLSWWYAPKPPSRIVALRRALGGCPFIRPAFAKRTKGFGNSVPSIDSSVLPAVMLTLLLGGFGGVRKWSMSMEGSGSNEVYLKKCCASGVRYRKRNSSSYTRWSKSILPCALCDSTSAW